MLLTFLFELQYELLLAIITLEGYIFQYDKMVVMYTGLVTFVKATCIRRYDTKNLLRI